MSQPNHPDQPQLIEIKLPLDNLEKQLIFYKNKLKDVNIKIKKINEKMQERIDVGLRFNEVLSPNLNELRLLSSEHDGYEILIKKLEREIAKFNN